jgi:16S rRNA (cytosine967-C5)-methyltransferase
VPIARSRGRQARRGDPARQAALDVLRAVAERDAYSNLLLPALLAERQLTGRDAALATELTYGTLRGQGSYDAILAICSDRGLDKIDPPIRDVLRLGAHQLLATGVRPHAAVATSVDLARTVAGPRPAGFVNAVLRRVAMRDLAGWLEIAAPPRGEDLVGHLSVAYSHPRWIVEAIAEALGEETAGGLTETEAALAADGERPGVTISAVPGLASTAELLSSGCEPARWSPFGGYLRKGDPAQIAAVAEGRAAVQDEASQLAALAVARADLGESGSGATAPADGFWLDVCAGPGGKARLLAGLARGQGPRLLAADLRPRRARMVRAATRPGSVRSATRSGSAPGGGVVVGGTAAGRDGEVGGTAAGRDGAVGGTAAGRDGAVGGAVPSVGVVVADGTAPAWRGGAFDRVLADVPCSGLGALRRRPEARWRRSPADLDGLNELQRRLLGAALDAARPGGIVGYVTCSPHVAETREVVSGVLAGRADVQVLDAPAVLAEVPGLRCPEPYREFAQFWPHRHGTDAIFIALLRRSRS